MKNKTPHKDLQHLQKLLDEIALLGPNDAARFKICKSRAARIVRKLKRGFPDLKTTIIDPKPEGSSMRHSTPPASGSGLK